MEAAASIGMHFLTGDGTFTVTEVMAQGLLVFSNDIYWQQVQGHPAPPPPHAEWGSPIHPELKQLCTLVDE